MRLQLLFVTSLALGLCSQARAQSAQPSAQPFGAAPQDPVAAPPGDSAAPPIAVPPMVAPPSPVRAVPPLPPREPGEHNDASKPLLSFGTEAYFVKPILAIAGGIHSENFLESLNQNKENRVTTVAITRFGLEGRLGPYVSFRSEFERNIGAHGSGVWEGTASFSSRDNFLRLSRWGITVDGGIILDPASVDFFSAHTADLLLADRYTRNPLLYSGFNRGQGLRAAYSRWGLTLGLAYTAGNPLSTSTSYQVGGSFSGGSRFWEKPLGNFRIGQPDDDFHFNLVSPSLTYEHKYIEVKTVAQVFWINYETSSKEDPGLFGYNLKANIRGKIPFHLRVPFMISPFTNFAWIHNDVLNNTSGLANTLLDNQFIAMSISGGVDFFIAGRSGLGVSYAVVMDDAPSYVTAMGGQPASELSRHTAQHYINGGFTYWMTEHVALGARVASYRKVQDNQPDELDVSFFTTMRVIL